MDDKSKRARKRAEAVVEYKKLTKKVQMLSRAEDPTLIQEIIKADVARLQELYPLVKRKLDGTAADSKHMRELLALCNDAAKRINVTNKPFDLRRIIQRLMRQANEESDRRVSKQEFCRQIVDCHVNTFLCSAPTLEFFYGALKIEEFVVKQRRKRVRHVIEEGEKKTAQERDIEVDVEKDSTPKEVEYIYQQLNRLARNKPEGVSFFETLIDPKSFTQTVENIFHSAFLVKEGKIGLKKDKNTKKAVLFVDDDNRDSTPRNQSVLSFSMEDYRNWLTKLKIKERAFAPRNQSEDY